MAENAQEKGRGFKFGEQQLLRHGWEQGKGLGRQENGISEAIKVKVKCGKGGVGHNEGEQFTFHWWDHVFNKASASLQVESDENGVSVKKMVEEEEAGMISNKKPRKASLAKAKLYGCFVKSATLLSGQEQPEPKASHSDDSSSSSDDEDQKLDLSSTTMLSDADLMKACGGRTAHKGARHGLTMSAKLARLEQQEAEFMAKYDKKSQSVSCTPKCTTPTAARSPEKQEKVILETKKTRNSSEEMYENSMSIKGDTVTDGHEADSNKSRKKKKKKKKKNRSDVCNGEITQIIPIEEELKLEENGTAGQPQIIKRKRKKSDNEEMGDITVHTDERIVEEVLSEQQSRKNNKTKRKKIKSSKQCERHVVPEEEQQINDADLSQAESAHHPVPKKRRDAVNIDEVWNESKDDKQTLQNGVCEDSMPQKKKKKKKKKCKDERIKPDSDN